MSQHDKAQTISTQRFSEIMGAFTKGKNILDDTLLNDIRQLSVPAMSVQVIELMK